MIEAMLASIGIYYRGYVVMYTMGVHCVVPRGSIGGYRGSIGGKMMVF